MLHQDPVKDKVLEARQEFDANLRRPWPYIIRGDEEIFAQAEITEGAKQTDQRIDGEVRAREPCVHSRVV